MQSALRQFKAELFRALGHPTRLALLEVLGTGDYTVTALQQALRLDNSAVSQQLAVLRTRGIVEGIKEGTAVRYHLRDRRILDLLAITREIFLQQLSAMQSAVDDDVVQPLREGLNPSQ